MNHSFLHLLSRSWLTVLIFLFLSGLNLPTLDKSEPAAKHLHIIQSTSPKPGDLDPTFGDQGISQADPGEAVAVQFDGKILVTGSLNGDFALSRYTKDGSIDASFGNGGRVFTDFDGRDDLASAITIQPDGKILVAGISNTSISMARYTTEGVLDPTFGKNGKAIPSPNGRNFSEIDDITLYRDGKIIAAGITPGYAEDVALARFNPDGSPDATFGSQGIVILSPGDSSKSTDILVQPDGMVAITGRAAGKMNAIRSAFLARLSINGSLDLLVEYDFPHDYSEYNDNDSANAVVLQTGGKFVIAGNTGGMDDQGFHHTMLALARFTSQGVLDPSFGDQGCFILRGPVDSLGSDIQIQTDGKLLVSGSIMNGFGGADFLLARFNPEGTLDTTFGEGGISLVDADDVDYEGSQVSLLRDGRIILGGNTYPEFGTGKHFILARLLNDAPALTPRIWFPLVWHP